MNESKKQLSTWQVLTQAPHRLFFLGGGLLAVLPLLWWSMHLMHRAQGDSLGANLALLPKEAHWVLMIFGFFTYFILGFYLTVVPRWLNLPALGRKVYLLFFAFFTSGLLLYVVGLVSRREIASVGMLLVTMGFAAVTSVTYSYLRAAEPKGQLQPWTTWSGVACGGLSAFFMALYLLLPHQLLYYRLSLGLGLYLYLPLVVLSVGYRMVPFFTSARIPGYEIRRVPLALKMWIVFSVLKAGYFVLDWTPGYAISDTGLLIACLIQFRQWEFFRKKPMMILIYLYVAFAWFPLANLLYIIEGLVAWNTGGGNLFLDLAALHAMTLGCFATLVYSMVTRVTLGHSGRELATGPFEDNLFWLLQLAALLRVGLELAGLINPPWSLYSYWAGYLWLLSFGLWGTRYLPIYLKPRIDGNPG